MNQLLWMVILVLVFVAGWWVGRYQATAERTSGPGAEMHREAALVSRELGSARLDSTPGSASESLSEELATGSWEAMEFAYRANVDYRNVVQANGIID